MDTVKEILQYDDSEEFSWKKYAIKQGYLIKFQRGLLKTPKMQYFVLTANGLISFEGKPNHDTEPLYFLPYEQLSSIKLDSIELNSSKLCCMQLTSKTNPNITLAFNRKEDRDDWMMIMMKAFSEALLTTRVFNRSSSAIDENKAGDDFTAKDIVERKASSLSKEKVERKISSSSTKEKLERKISSSSTKEKLERKISTGSNGQSFRRKRRKGEKGSIRKSKSYDSLALHDVTNTGLNFPNKRLSENPLRPEAENVSSLADSRKRKSVPDIHVISHFPSAWATDSKEQLFQNSCSFEHRDSLTVQAQRQLKSKADAKHKTNVFAKLRSKLEHPVKH